MYLYSSSSGGKDLCNDIEIRVIGSVRPEICTKCSEIRVRNRVQTKLPLTTLGYSMPHLIVDFREFLNWKQAQKKSLHQKDKKRRKKPIKDIQVTSQSQTFDFCACPSENVIKRDASGKTCCNVANDSLSRLHLIWLIPRLQMSRKSVYLGKNFGNQ